MHHTKSMLTQEEITSESDQTTGQAIPNVTPFAFLVVESIFYIVGAKQIGFGSEYAAVDEMANAVDVWEHHPVVGINEQLHVPVVDLSGLESSQ